MNENKSKIRNTYYFQTLWLVVIIVLVRVLIIDLYTELQAKYDFTLYHSALAFFYDYAVFLFSIVVDLIFIIIINNQVPYGKTPLKRIGISALFIGCFSAISTLLTNRNLLFSHILPPAYNSQLLISFTGVSLVNVCAILCFDVIIFFIQQHRTLQQESNKKRKAQYQYQQLKQQLNPHFLFNSLNILDYLVQNEPRERASDFIKKMAGVYRYLLKTGENKLVSIEEELRFVNMYTDLLKERFPAGLYLSVEIPNFYQKQQVIPCGLQILVENATKHNIVNSDNPLYIKIYVNNTHIIVQNNIQPRLTYNESTGIGLSNIQKQYKDIANKKINIKRSKNKFLVKLPLLAAKD